jgi:DNA-binding MurR/RpiR family transcriptional regulator
MVVSQSGRWQAIVEAVHSAQERGIKVICLSGNAASVLAMAADLTFITANPTFRVAGHPYTLRAAQATLIDALVLEAVRVGGLHQVERPGTVQESE